MATVQAAVTIPSGDVALDGALVLPDRARGVVLFAHGSGSSRKSPRNTFVARTLRAEGVGTLLFDLLTVAEDADYERRFEIELLSRRLADGMRFVRDDPRARGLAVGLFGASTGAAAALQVAARFPGQVSAVVSRGGRPDLAGPAALGSVRRAALPQGARDRSRRHAPVRGAWHARGRGAARRGVVRPAPRARHVAELGSDSTFPGAAEGESHRPSGKVESDPNSERQSRAVTESA